MRHLRSISSGRDRTFSASGQRFECLGLFDLQSRHEPVELLPGKPSHFRLVLWPPEPAIDRQPLIQEDDTILFVQDRLDPVVAPPAEEEQGIILFAHMEFLFDDCTETVDLFSHISTAALSKC